MSAENEIKLLWNCANSLDANTHTKRLLKSYYLTTSRELCENQLQMPKEKFSAARMCTHCCSFWTENEFQLKLHSQNIKRTSKVKKLLEKLKVTQNAEKNKHLLTGKQKRRAKWLKKRTTKNIELICKFCQHKTQLPLEKSKNPQSKIAAQNLAELPNTNVKQKKKKKHKNKDKNAGLNLTKINTQMNETTLNVKSKTKIAVKVENKTKPNLPNVSSIPKSNVNATLTSKKMKKTKTKAQKLEKNHSTSTIPKFQSKTQQQNSLLKLAALLKTQATKAPTNTQKNRLEALLK